MEKNISLTLNTKDLNHIVESLLFASSVSVGANWNIDTCENMVILAKQLKETLSEDLNLKHLNFFKEDCYEDSWSEQILKEFGNDIEIISLEDSLK